MARKLSAKEAQETQFSEVGAESTGRRPWDEWIEAEHGVELIAGKDFTITIAQFNQQAKNVANRRGLTYSYARQDDKLKIRFTPKEEEQA